MNDSILIERKKKHILLYNLRNKYKNKLIFDKIQRSAYRIAYFFKKYILYEAIDYSNECLGLYKFRFKYNDIPIMINLNNYIDQTLTNEIIIDENIYVIDNDILIRMKNQIDKINKKQLNGDRFIQMINWSKELSKAYNRENDKIFK